MAARVAIQKITLVLLTVFFCANIQAAKDTLSNHSFLSRFNGLITLQRGYQFQGIDQSQGDSMLHLGLEYQLSDDFTAGIWLGEFNFPGYLGKSREVDYFLGYNKALSFSHNIHTSVWYYSFIDDDLNAYDWTQWLAGYEFNGWLNLTLGVSADYGLQQSSTWFADVTLRRSDGPLTTSVSFSRNDLSNTKLVRFDAVRVKGTYNWKRWHLFADFTISESDADAYQAMFIHDGWGFGLSYDF